MERIKLFVHSLASQGAKALAEELSKRLGYKVWRIQRPRKGKIINWGSTQAPPNVINKPEAVAMAINKIWCLGRLQQQEVRVPEFSLSKATASQWVKEGFMVVCRATATGTGGAGVTLISNVHEEVPDAVLYTKHVRHKREFRVHVFGDKVVHIQEKLKKNDFPDEQRNPYIRNHDKGWVYAQNNIDAPEDVKVQAVNAVKALGLDFGAADVAYREKEQQAFILEVNTAPGLEGTTIIKYAEELAHG